MRKIASHAAHLAAEVALGIAGFGVLAGIVFAFRLSHGPIDITWLATRAAARLSADHFSAGGAGLRVGAAELVYEGFSGANSPIDIRVHDVRATDARGAILLDVPRARVTLSLRQLVMLRAVPRAIEIDGAALALTRGPNGALQVELHEPAPRALSQSDALPAATGAGDVSAVLRELARPVRSGDDLPWLSELRLVRLQDCSVVVHDGQTGAVWTAPHATIDLARANNGGVTGVADVQVSVGAQSASLHLAAESDGAGTHISAHFGPVTPAALARIANLPGAAAMIDAPVTLDGDVSLDAALTPRHGRLDVALGAGHINLPHGTLAITRAYAALHGDPAGVVVSGLEIDPVAARENSPAPVLRLHGGVQFVAEGGYDVSADVTLDTVAFADLATYWPAGVGTNARKWVTENVVGGRAHDASVHVAAHLPADLSDATVTALSGGIIADDATVYWLKPVPPITDAALKLQFDGPDRLHVDIARGRQGDLTATDGRVTISGLAGKDQFAEITAQINGSLPDTLVLLAHPRLHLLSRRPLDFTDPRGSIRAHVSVKLPLQEDISDNDIKILADAALADVHLGDVAAHRDLDQGMLTLHVTNAGLTIDGAGSFSDLPTDLALKMDFRDGLLGQIQEQLRASATVDAVSGPKAGLPDGIITNGHAPIVLSYASPRGAPSSIAIAADLTPAELTLPIGWHKKIGEPARADFHLTLAHGHLASIDRISFGAPQLAIDATCEVANNAPSAVDFSRIEIDRSRATGRVILPIADTDPYRVTLAGPDLDLVAFFKSDDENPGDDADDTKPGPRYVADLVFDHVDLVGRQAVTRLKLHAENDGQRTQAADIFARGAGDIRFRIARSTAGRTLSVDTADAGTVLLALNISSAIHGGSLKLAGVYDDRRMPPTLKGTAELKSFSVLDAPSIGRLLQAMTLYGVADLARGPGLGFAQLIAPFSYHGRRLDLTNARAFSPSLGITAGGTIDLRHKNMDISGTIVPAYFFNQLLGDIPLLGRIFSPEKGGGVFAARYTMRGKISAPDVSVNPLSALTPGALRGVFGLMDAKPKE